MTNLQATASPHTPPSQMLAPYTPPRQLLTRTPSGKLTPASTNVPTLPNATPSTENSSVAAETPSKPTVQQQPSPTPTEILTHLLGNLNHEASKTSKSAIIKPLYLLENALDALYQRLLLLLTTAALGEPPLSVLTSLNILRNRALDIMAEEALLSTTRAAEALRTRAVQFFTSIEPLVYSFQARVRRGHRQAKKAAVKVLAEKKDVPEEKKKVYTEAEVAAMIKPKKVPGGSAKKSARKPPQIVLAPGQYLGGVRGMGNGLLTPQTSEEEVPEAERIRSEVRRGRNQYHLYREVMASG
ncbi:hypothetical protein EDC01DRAFT_776700 [Geopyxis carbonaria]|nr:hypothetical protein EDC01DRAFT_776700 [Geopyxis carbonaria]